MDKKRKKRKRKRKSTYPRPEHTDLKSRVKRIRYGIGLALVAGVEFLIPRLPLWLMYGFLEVAFSLLYPITYLIPPVRTVVSENLYTVFGTAISRREKRRIARQALKNIFLAPFNCIYYFHPKNMSRIVDDVEIVGLEHIHTALEGGSGVIGLGAHVGNFVLLTMRFAQSDVPFIVVTKDPRNRAMKDKFTQWKQSFNIPYIDADKEFQATKDIIRALKENHLVYLLADERKKFGGISVPFFGKAALTAPGPAVLAIRTGAPILPLYITRKTYRKHTIEIGPSLPVELTGEKERDIYAITLRANEAIEEMILKYPDQWTWLNRRWRL
jgi:KDO2-lipid IV(A) lauroyltransferase